MVSIALDSSTEVCSAALLRDGEIVAERVNLVGSNHAALLPVYVQEIQAQAADLGLKIDSVVLSEGPGSYTGLRIATSLAKGLCYGLDIPLIAVPTLAVMAYEAVRNQHGSADRQKSEVRDQKSAVICPMIDARRMEVYCAAYEIVEGLKEIRPVSAVVVDEQSFAPMLSEHEVYFCGNGADKCKAVIQHPNARWIDGIVPRAAAAGQLAELGCLVTEVRGKDIAYFEPNYLKEFVAAPSHVKGLR